MKKIVDIKDALINVTYSLMSVNSKALAKTLKDNLSSKSIDYNEFNDDYLEGYSEKKPKVINLPAEVYEYQNFFLLEKDNGELILLDGFRRLLWNETVDHEILVRVYKERDMTEHSILKLLVALNHTKFFGGIGNFYDRGFALGMYVIFGVDITKNYKCFNGYLTVSEPKYSYFVSRLHDEKAHASTLDKVTNVAFIEDMRFLESLQKTDILEMDDVFGAFISHIRQANPEVKLNAEDFIAKIKANPVLVKQIKSFKKSKDSRGNDIGNKMFEMFTNILLNKVGEKSFAERETEIKDLVTKMKKEKDWFNYTGNKKYFFSMISNLRDKEYNLYKTLGVEGAIKAYREQHGEYPKVKVFVYPSEREVLPEGVYDDFEIVGFTTKTHLISSWNIIEVKRGDVTLKRTFMRDNNYDLSCIKDRKGNVNLSNDVVLFIKDLVFEIEK
jgi:hypothetical protein